MNPENYNGGLKTRVYKMNEGVRSKDGEEE